LLVKIRISRSLWGTGIGRSHTSSTSEKIATFAPIPRARVAIATAVKPGDVRNFLAAYRRSPETPFIANPPPS